MAFPKNFLWGTATSAAQIEGAPFEDGRTASIWDEFAKKTGRIFNGETPGTACNSYHLFDEDLKNMKNLGVNSYRMSISWSRVLPEGTGKLNDKGMDYYKWCLISCLKIISFQTVTLYHWDLPQVLEDKGGFVNRDCINWLGEYAHKMFTHFGDIIPMWSTVNEPIAVYVGYAHGGFAPRLY